MQQSNITRAVLEASRFLARAKEYQEAVKNPHGSYEWEGKIHKTHPAAPMESGSLRRASLDLTRALAAMRRP